MPSLPESERVKFSIEPSGVKEQRPVIYIYDSDIPTKIRLHERHRLIVTGDPAVTTIGRTSLCLCQMYLDSLPNTPFATEELKKEFWTNLHLTMPQQDAERKPRLQKMRRKRNRERKAAAQKEKDNGEGSAQKAVTDSSTDSSNSDEQEERETRQQRSGGGTAAESVAERAESD